jgi:hypothetical protein
MAAYPGHLDSLACFERDIEKTLTLDAEYARDPNVGLLLQATRRRKRPESNKKKSICSFSSSKRFRLPMVCTLARH